ncbi:MAG: hypothetical protein, partial [Olavius algarvensis Gamma 1 endosymbiont]
QPVGGATNFAHAGARAAANSTRTVIPGEICGLGRLMTKGILDRSLKDRTEPEQRRAQAMAWIETLKGGGVA